MSREVLRDLLGWVEVGLPLDLDRYLTHCTLNSITVTGLEARLPCR